MLTVGVLGEVEVHRDGVRLDLPRGKTTELLTRLALDAGSRVRADALIEDLWAGPTGKNTLQSKVSQLRRALGDKSLVVSTGNGYTLAVDQGSVDAQRATELAAQTSDARGSDDAAVALESAEQGLALFRGRGARRRRRLGEPAPRAARGGAAGSGRGRDRRTGPVGCRR